ncbi:hypothetical protein B0H13DRAFT_1870834 [Mycena leptocephala]|nr:hypothetical protein B0H13DRAFT_1870834 [Mycena leptocephala]
MFWLGLALKPWLWLGFIWLWLRIHEAKAKAMDEGLAWLWLKPRLRPENFKDPYKYVRKILILHAYLVQRYPMQTYLADVELTVLKLVFYASVKAVTCWLGFGFPNLKPKPKPTASQTFGLAWLDQATALASWHFGLKPSHGHH